MLALLLLGCAAGVTPDAESTTPTDSVATTEGPDTGPGEVFEVADPTLTVEFDGAVWSTSTGYWFGSEDLSSVRGELTIDATTSESFTLITDGDIHHSGSFPVTSVDYVRQVSAGGDVFHFLAFSPAGLRLIVEGRADGDQIFAHLDGSATVTDNVGGSSMSLREVTLVSWHER